VGFHCHQLRASAVKGAEWPMPAPQRPWRTAAHADVGERGRVDLDPQSTAVSLVCGRADGWRRAEYDIYDSITLFMQWRPMLRVRLAAECSRAGVTAFTRTDPPGAAPRCWSTVVVVGFHCGVCCAAAANATCSSRCWVQPCWGPGDDECVSCPSYRRNDTRVCLESCDEQPRLFADHSQPDNRQCRLCHPQCRNSCTGPVSAVMCLSLYHHLYRSRITSRSCCLPFLPWTVC